MLQYKELFELLRSEIRPALGCTEPVAIALAAAKAASLIDGTIRHIHVEVSRNIYKNALAVTIPNTHESGLELAAALGALCRNPDKELELLDDITNEDIKLAKQLIADHTVTVTIAPQGGLFIKARVETAKGYAAVYVEGGHTQVVKTIVNGTTADLDTAGQLQKRQYDLTRYSLDDLIIAIETVDLAEISFLQEGIDMNLFIAAKGLETEAGLGVGAGLQKMMNQGIVSNDVMNKARVAVAAACDARMAGLGYPVMTTMGSGNQGIGATVPLAIVAREYDVSNEKLLRSLALSNLVTAYVKQFTGKLSSACGCSIAAGVGVTAAVAWLMGGTSSQVKGAMQNMIGNLAGMICDGAKGGCALKLATSAAEAIFSAQLALQNIIISSKDGIIGSTIEATIKNLGAISAPGNDSMGDAILAIMLEKSRKECNY